MSMTPEEAERFATRKLNEFLGDLNGFASRGASPTGHEVFYFLGVFLQELSLLYFEEKSLEPGLRDHLQLIDLRARAEAGRTWVKKIRLDVGELDPEELEEIASEITEQAIATAMASIRSE